MSVGEGEIIPTKKQLEKENLELKMKVDILMKLMREFVHDRNEQIDKSYR